MFYLRPSTYCAKFRADAVALVRTSKPRRTVADVAAELSVNRETLRSWVRTAEARDARARAPRRPKAVSRSITP